MTTKPTGDGNGPTDRMKFPALRLIDEMYSFSKKKHAETVYRKCIKAKKYKLAMKIAYHYGLQDENNNNDTVIALSLAMMARNKITRAK